MLRKRKNKAKRKQKLKGKTMKGRKAGISRKLHLAKNTDGLSVPASPNLFKWRKDLG